MMFLILWFVVSAIVIAIAAYPLSKSFRLPKDRPSEYLKQFPSDQRRVIVLAGDSLTHGLIGYGYINMLKEDLDLEKYALVNAGINANLTWNLSERLDEIIDCNPSIVTILIGTNDANAATSEKEGRAYKKNMNLPRLPDHRWFRETLQALVKRLQTETTASIALLSIPPIGEDPMHDVFRLSLEYGNTVREVASEMNVTYLPLQERMVTYLRDTPGSPKHPFKRNRIRMLLTIYQYYLLKKSWDQIAEESGFQLHTDYLHLNSLSARMIADLILDFIHSTEVSNR